MCVEVYSREMVSVREGLFPRDGAVCGELYFLRDGTVCGEVYSREMVRCAGWFIPEGWCCVRGALFQRDGAVCGEVYSRRMVRCAGSFIPESWCSVRGGLFPEKWSYFNYSFKCSCKSTDSQSPRTSRPDRTCAFDRAFKSRQLVKICEKERGKQHPCHPCHNQTT